MKKRKLFVTAIMVTMMTMTACGNNSQSDSTEPKNSEVAKATTQNEILPTEATEETVPEPTGDIEPATEPDTSQNDADDVLDGVRLLFNSEEGDESTGFISSTVEGLEEVLANMGAATEELAMENLTDTDEVLYHFTMTNQSSAQLTKTGDSNTYMTALTYNNENYYVLFGSEDADAAEVEVFSQAGTTLDYWGIVSVSDDVCMVVPMIAGNAEHGYYIVRPALISTGVDMSGTMSLVEQGIDFTTTDTPDTENTSGSGDAGLTGTESIKFNITNVEPYDNTLTVYYTMTNTYPLNVYLADETITLNGEDITDSVSGYFTVDANDSVDDFFMIENHNLQAGDELIIKGMLTDGDTFDDIGEIQFKLVME